MARGYGRQPRNVPLALDESQCFMYFRVMSLSLGNEGRFAQHAIAVCDHMLAVLDEALVRHEHAAARARPDWEGPHRDEFEERVADLRARLRGSEGFVRDMRHAAERIVERAEEDLREARAAARREQRPW